MENTTTTTASAGYGSAWIGAASTCVRDMSAAPSLRGRLAPVTAGVKETGLPIFGQLTVSGHVAWSPPF